MEVLNIVFLALNLLATVVIGTIQLVWMVARDVFRDRPKAKHDSHDKNLLTACQEEKANKTKKHRVKERNFNRPTAREPLVCFAK